MLTVQATEVSNCSCIRIVIHPFFRSLLWLLLRQLSPPPQLLLSRLQQRQLSLLLQADMTQQHRAQSHYPVTVG